MGGVKHLELLLELIEAKKANDQGQVAFVRQALRNLKAVQPNEVNTMFELDERYNEHWDAFEIAFKEEDVVKVTHAWENAIEGGMPEEQANAVLRAFMRRPRKREPIDLGLQTRHSQYQTYKQALAEADRYNEAKTTAEQ